MVKINLFAGKELDMELDFPTDWNELKKKEVLEICRLQLHNGQLHNLSRVEFFMFLIGSRAKNLPTDWKALLDMDDICNSLHLLDFIYNENNLTKQPLTTLKVGKKELVGLANDFENITCGEFEELEVLFFHAMEKPSQHILAKMAAIMFREKDVQFQTIHFERLVTYDFASKAAAFMALPPHILYTAFMWYCGCRFQLPKKFPTVYNSDDVKDDIQPDVLSFTKCIHAGAGQKNGSRNQIRLTPLLEFMFDMEQEAIKTNELNAQYEQ